MWVNREAILPCVLAVSLLACAQAPPLKPSEPAAGANYYEQFRQARDFAKQEKYVEAAAIYERLTQTYPNDSEIG